MEKQKLKKIAINDIKKISLEILLDVASFCEENDITYYLACGTLLGAIRHQGFIPWDDDIDIMMPRPDFKRFLSLYEHKKYELLKPSVGIYNYAKVYDPNTVKYEKDLDYKTFKPFGVDIDVFPLDGIVDDEKIVAKLYKRECILETFLRLATQPIFYRKNPLKAINRILPRLIGRKNWLKMIEKNAQTYTYESSAFVVRFRQSSNGFTGALPKSVYDKDYAMFEGHKLCVPKGYDKWLKTFYGDDYMSLPSEEKRKIHDVECYYL